MASAVGLQLRGEPLKSRGHPLRVCFVAHRLGGHDGVSVEAAKWQDALIELGCSVTRVAGHFADRVAGTDVELTGLWAPQPGESPPPPDTARITHLCRTHDLLVLDNVGSLPSAPAAALAFEEAALRAGVPTIVRHHDPAWQVTSLPGSACPGFPLHDPRMLHVTINRHTEKQFRKRYPALARSDAVTTIYNTVDVAGLQSGDRGGTRSAMRIGEDDILLAHPARNVERKNVPAAIELAAQLRRYTGRNVHYWITDRTGTLDVSGDTPIIHRGHVSNPADLYAAADLVALPSTWEGWGLPVVEAAAAHRIAITRPYPILDEIHQLGIRTFDHTEIRVIAGLISNPSRYQAVTTRNHHSAQQLDVAELLPALRRAYRGAAALMAAAGVSAGSV